MVGADSWGSDLAAASFARELQPKICSSKELIVQECRALEELLLRKNEKYGNSALEPIRIFSKASSTEQLLVRIDDKLSRIRTSGLDGPDEDTVVDLAGYLVLLLISRKSEQK